MQLKMLIAALFVSPEKYHLLWSRVGTYSAVLVWRNFKPTGALFVGKYLARKYGFTCLKARMMIEWDTQFHSKIQIHIRQTHIRQIKILFNSSITLETLHGSLGHKFLTTLFFFNSYRRGQIPKKLFVNK